MLFCIWKFIYYHSIWYRYLNWYTWCFKNVILQQVREQHDIELYKIWFCDFKWLTLKIKVEIIVKNKLKLASFVSKFQDWVGFFKFSLIIMFRYYQFFLETKNRVMQGLDVSMTLVNFTFVVYIYLDKKIVISFILKKNKHILIFRQKNSKRFDFSNMSRTSTNLLRMPPIIIILYE